MNASAKAPPGKGLPARTGTGTGTAGATSVTTVAPRGSFQARGSGGHVQWARRYGQEYLRPYGVALSATGEVYLTASLNTQTQGATPAAQASQDIFVAKLDPMGATLWSKFFTGKSGSRIVSDIAADPAGNLLLTGVLRGQISLGKTNVLSSAGWSAKEGKGPGNVLFAKLSPTGQPILGKRYGAVKDAAGQLIGTDDKGQMVIGGAFSGNVDFGGGPMKSTGKEEVFVVKLDTRGRQAWTKRFVASTDLSLLDLTVAPAGDVAIGGIFSGTLDLGGGPLHSMSPHNGFVARYGATGKHAMSLRLGNAIVESVALDRQGNLVVAGEAPQQPDPFWAAMCKPGDSHPFVVKFDAEGKLIGSKCFGDAHGHQISKVAVDAEGRIYLAGTSRGLLDFGGGTLLPMGQQDVFLVQLDPTLRHLWSKRFATGDHPEGVTLAVDDAGNAVLTGAYSDAFDAGSGQRLPAGAGVFVAKFAP